jgi:C1A family cysteine protease
LNKIIVDFVIICLFASIIPFVNSTTDIEYNYSDYFKSDILTYDENYKCESIQLINNLNKNFNQNLDNRKRIDIELKLKRIIDAIKSNNADWIADHTTISDSILNKENNFLGCIPDVLNDDDYEDILYYGTLPDVFDWRDVSGVDYTTSIKSQGGCGSCTAFGTIGAVESVVKIEYNNSFECDISEADLFFCGGGGCDIGMYVSDALIHLRNEGVSDELCFTYRPRDLPCNDKCINWQDRAVKISSYGWITSTVRDIRNALIEHGPLVTTMKVYDDFHYYRGGVYSHVSGDFSGWHCVTIVGYDNINEYWICKNSWGTDWGENGWFKIEYGQCEIGTDTAYISSVTGNFHPFTPSNPSPRNNEINLEPNVNLSWSDCMDLNDDEVFYNVYLKKDDSHTDDLVASHIDTPYFYIENLEKNSIYSWMVIAEDENGAQCEGSNWRFGTRLPYKPIVEGTLNGNVRIEYTFNASTTDIDGQEYFWFFDWGDETNTGWLGPYGPGEVFSASHTWTKQGDFQVWVRYKEDSVISEITVLNISMSKNKNFDIFNTWIFRLIQHFQF